MKKYMIRDFKNGIENKQDFRDLTLEEACIKFGDLVSVDMTALRDLRPAVWKGMMTKIDNALIQEGGVAVIAPGIVIAYEVSAE